jgi:hypothetical protein
MPKKQVEAPFRREVVEVMLGWLHGEISRIEFVLVADGIVANREQVEDALRLYKGMQNYDEAPHVCDLPIGHPGGQCDHHCKCGLWSSC